MIFKNKYILLIGLFILSLNVFANVNVTSGGNLNLCVGTTYSTIGKITIAEGSNSDFSISADVRSYEINAPSNFEFNPGNGSVTASGGDVKFSALTVTATKITLYYLVTTTGSSDRFELTNIQVRATSPSGSQNLVRTGGDAVQAGNNPYDKVHATLTANQANVSLNASANVVCANSSDINLNGSPNGGTYSIAPSSSALNGNIFKPTISGAGSFVVKYIVTQNGCTGRDSIIITVKPIPAVTFFGLANSYCSGDDDAPLIGFPSGGNFSGNGIVNTSFFRPSDAGVGSNKSITYTYTANGCTGVSVMQTSIKQSPTVEITLTPDQNNYFSAQDSVKIGGSQSNPSTGGVITVSGNGVTSSGGIDLFHPNAVGQANDIFITRILQAPNGCIATKTKTVSVAQSVGSTINGLSATYCKNSEDVTITVNNDHGVFYAYYLIGGLPLYNAPQIIIDDNLNDGIASFSPKNAPYIGSYLIIFSGNNGSASTNVEITGAPSLGSSNIDSAYCNSQAAFGIVASGSSGGSVTFSGVGVNSNNQFNPKIIPLASNNSVLTPIYYTYTDMNNCKVLGSINVKIKKAPTGLSILGLDSKNNYCDSAKSYPLTGSPSGGYFKSGIGMGTGVNNSIFYPQEAVKNNGNLITKDYVITYIYADPINGCSASVDSVAHVSTLPKVSISKLSSQYCNSDNEVNLTGFPSNGTDGGVGTFSINTNSSNEFENRIFSPQKAIFGNYKIKYTFTDGVTKCVNVDSTMTIVRKNPNANFTNLEPSYCALNGISVELNGSPVGEGASYTSVAGTAAIAGGKFDVDVSGVGKHTIIFTYKDEFGCSASVTKVTTVYGSPKTKKGVKTPVKLSTACENDFITLSDNNSDLISENNAASSIITANWLIDTTQIANNYKEEPIVKLRDGNHKIVYKLTTDKGCSTSFDTTVSIGSYPKTNFTWDEICNNEDTKFQNTTPGLTVGKITKVEWDFSDPLDPGKVPITISSGINGNTSHTYTTPTSYEVFLTAYSDYNCVTTISKDIFILDSKRITSSEPYSNDFNDKVGDWVPATAIDSIPTSWVLETPNKKYIKPVDGAAWVTNKAGSYNADEKSYVYSPCFTMDYTITKPMIHLDVFSMTNLNASGANLQYSTNGKDWKPLGKRNETGVNWYNNTGNIASRPSGSELDQDGWTGLDSASGWKNARHIFDDVLAVSRNIRFRISFAGNKDTTDGFAFDNVWIGDRKRLVLAEHFTNNASSNTVQDNVELNKLLNANQNGNYPKDIIALQYHTAFPGSDPMYARNIPDAGARSLYYGVTQVPYSVVDGSYYKGNTARINQQLIDTRCLYDPAFDIVITSSITSNTVSVKYDVKNKIPVQNSVTVYVSVLERSVNGVTGSNGEKDYEWVHAKFLSDAAGTSYSSNWAVGDIKTNAFTWPFTTSNVYDPQKLAVIVFVQDNVTKEIYQAGYLGIGSNVITGIFDPNEETSTVTLYPNPANDLTNVVLNGSLAGDYSWCVIDGLGRIVDQGIAADQADDFTINTQAYPSGFYTLRLSNAASGIKTQKFVVVH